MKLLIVDDSMITRSIIAKFAKKNGHTIVGEAGDGIKGIEILQKSHPDAVTLDMVMPNIGGVECVRKMMEIDNTVKIVVFSAIVSQENMIDAVNAGAKAFIEKPLNNEKLEKAFKILSEA